MKLYQNLIDLTKNNEAFYYVDHQLDDQTYRTFSYRLASYTDFEADGAYEARGIMLNITEPSWPKIASRPMEKFWNIEELENRGFVFNPDDIERLENKRDGSLISTFLHSGQVRLKSKTSLTSIQAKDAYEYYLNRCETDEEFKNDIEFWVNSRYTVNFEWTSPYNRIVIGYANPELKILNVRHNETGLYLSFDKHEKYSDSLFSNSVLADDFDSREDIEGVVIILNDGTRIKKKTEKYKQKHKAKDKIMNDRGLFEAVIDGVTDDIKSIFSDSDFIVKRIEEFENKFIPMYNHFVNTVERFHAENKHFDRKEYAIKAKNETDDIAFPMIMNLYIGRDNDYQERYKKAWKSLGVLDKRLNEE